VTYRVFYSWQSDRPSKYNRSLIEAAAERAIKRVRADGVVELALDRDVRGVGGTPDIAETIFRKIRACDIFLADVTPAKRIGMPWSREGIPNPNVMLELGYAVRDAGWDNVVCVLNTAYGRAQGLPFHLKQRRHPIEYHCDLSSGSTGPTRDRLSDALGGAFKEIIGRSPYPRHQGIAFQFHAGLYDDSVPGLRTVHVVVRNVAGLAICNGMIEVTDATGRQLPGVPARFSANPSPTQHNIFTPEVWQSTKGQDSPVPLVVKQDGSTDAHLFTTASAISPNGIYAGAPVLGLGKHRLRISVGYGADAPAVKQFEVHNNGPLRTDLTLVEVQ
jgi:hypothetical protein